MFNRRLCWGAGLIGLLAFLFPSPGNSDAGNWDFAMPGRQCDVGTPVLNGKIRAVCDTNGKWGLYSFDPSTRSWTKDPAFTPVLHFSSLIASGDSLYRIGSNEAASPAGEMYRLTPGRGGWVRTRPIPHPRINYTACGWGGTIFVFGGTKNPDYAGKEEIIEEVDAFNIQSERWKSAGKIPIKMRRMISLQEDDGILIIGSENPGYSRSPQKIDFFKYNPPSGSLARMADYDLKWNMSILRAAIYGSGFLSLWCGDLGYVWNASSSNWEEVTPLPEYKGSWGSNNGIDRKNVSAVVAVGGTVYAFGATGWGGLDTLDIYNPETRIWTPVPVHTRKIAEGAHFIYQEGERYGGKDVGIWSLHREEGATLFTDIYTEL